MNFSRISNPNQAVLVSCRDDSSQKDNLITIAWHCPVSIEPPLYAVSLGKTRFSTGMIRKAGCFSVNFMSGNFEKEVLFCGRHSGMHVDKFKECGFSKQDANTVDCTNLKEASGIYECEVIKEVEAGDHIIFIGRVTHHELREDKDRLMHLGGDIFKSIS